jgi:hypothetical protein
MNAATCCSGSFGNVKTHEKLIQISTCMMKSTFDFNYLQSTASSPEHHSDPWRTLLKRGKHLADLIRATLSNCSKYRLVQRLTTA